MSEQPAKQALQWSGLVSRSVQEPPKPHIVPPGQLHIPALQSEPFGHDRKHEPHADGSVAVSTQLPPLVRPQERSPRAHLGHAEPWTQIAFPPYVQQAVPVPQAAHGHDVHAGDVK